MKTFEEIFTETKIWMDAKAEDSDSDTIWVQSTALAHKEFRPYYEYIKEQAITALVDVSTKKEPALIVLCSNLDWMFHLGMLVQKKLMENNREEDVNI